MTHSLGKITTPTLPIERNEKAEQKRNIIMTLFEIFPTISDNGGSHVAGGNNLPLRGGKSQYFEGGIRVVAFINSPLICEMQRGTVFDGLMGAADWFPTFVNGIGRSTLKTEGLDGVNMWDSLRYSVFQKSRPVFKDMKIA